MGLISLVLAGVVVWALIRLGRQTEGPRRGQWRVAATLISAALLAGGLLALSRGVWITGAGLCAAALWLTVASRIRAAVATYPHRAAGTYSAWPGPNSNTFVAHVLRAVPDLAVSLPPTALGKDFSDRPIAWTPSRTGVQLSARGYLGLTLGWVEGIEVNVLGAVAGLDLRRPALKLPGWGRIGMDPAGATETLIAPTASS